VSGKSLDFSEISRKIEFVRLLDWLNIPYQKAKGEIKGETDTFKFVINIKKDLFFSPGNDQIKGSVINFYSKYEGIGLRESALILDNEFIHEAKPKQVDMPILELHYVKELEKFGISEEIAKEYEIGLVKQRSIMNGRIAFRMYDEFRKPIGYVGWHPKKQNWLFPKGLKRPLFNIERVETNENVVVTVDLFDCMRIIGLGFTNTVCLIAKSLTEKQEELLQGFKSILLLHPEPDNIASRLAKHSYIKAPELIKPLSNHSDEEILSLLKDVFA
jgi:DNA primase